jgi:tetratricopeptide (TPR) repeat protein
LSFLEFSYFVLPSLFTFLVFQVLLLEVEQLVLENDTDTAIKLVEKANKSGNYDEFIILNMRATIQTHLAFMAFHTGNPQAIQHAQSLFEEINALYTKALELDPESLEVKAQFAQLKSMVFGDLESSNSLLKDALSIARSRDEVQDLLAVSYFVVVITFLAFLIVCSSYFLVPSCRCWLAVKLS